VRGRNRERDDRVFGRSKERDIDRGQTRDRALETRQEIGHGNRTVIQRRLSGLLEPGVHEVREWM
jgi:hypothetical protein